MSKLSMYTLHTVMLSMYSFCIVGICSTVEPVWLVIICGDLLHGCKTVAGICDAISSSKYVPHSPVPALICLYS